MPIHRGETYLGATLESAAIASPEGIEFLLYNSAEDGGAARRIADSFTGRLNIKWADVPHLQSWSAKTNLGVREAGAAHVAMLHQDDLWLPDHVAAIRRSVTHNPDAALSIASTRYADANGRVFGRWRLPFRSGPLTEAEFVSTLMVQNSIAIPTPVIRRDAWLRAGGMDEGLWYTADWDMYLKLAHEGQIVVRGEVTTAFRLHSRSLTMEGSLDLGDFRWQLEQVVDRHLGRVPATRRGRVAQWAQASVDVNCALAGASHGRAVAMRNALLPFLRLSPSDLLQYLRRSRIVDRVVPRLQLAAAGRL